MRLWSKFKTSWFLPIMNCVTVNRRFRKDTKFHIARRVILFLLTFFIFYNFRNSFSLLCNLKLPERFLQRDYFFLINLRKKRKPFLIFIVVIFSSEQETWVHGLIFSHIFYSRHSIFFFSYVQLTSKFVFKMAC